MEPRYLVDTNAIIDFSEGKLSQAAHLFIASIIDSTPHFSVINKIELLSLPIVSAVVMELLAFATVIELSDAIVERTIAIRKKRRIKLPDAIIAATAIEHNLIVVTRNLVDFQHIKGLKVINPWDK